MQRNTGTLVVAVACLLMQHLHCQETEVCDVMAMVRCFYDMPELNPVDEVAQYPDQEIVVPCMEHRDEIQNLEACLAVATAGCPSVHEDAAAWIHRSNSFCDSVLGECLPYADKHLDIYGCMSEWYGHVQNQAADADRCVEMQNCLLRNFDSCHALGSVIEQTWGQFDHMCLNSSLSLNDPHYIAGVTNEQPIQCAELDDLSKNIEDCYISELTGTMASPDLNVTTYCSSVSVLESCVAAELEAASCAAFGEVYRASLVAFQAAIKPFCSGVNPPEEVVCDMASITQCLAQTETSIWNVLSVVRDDGMIRGMEGIKDAVAQATALNLVSDLATTCDEAEGAAVAAEQCLQANMAGCEADVLTAASTQASFLTHFCDTIDNCTMENSFEEALRNCSTHAEQKLRAAAMNDTLSPDQFIMQFCGTLQEMAVCMRDLLEPCTGESMHVNTMLEILVRDLDPVCPRDAFDVLNITKATDETIHFLECSDMAEASVLIGECDAIYLQDLFLYPTNSSHICRTLNEWQECLETLVSECWMLTAEMFHMLQSVRDEFGDACPAPVPESPSDSGEHGSDSDSDSDEGLGDSAAFLTTPLLAVLSMSFLALVLA